MRVWWSQAFSCSESRLESSAEGICSFLFSRSPFCWGKKYLNATLARRGEMLFSPLEDDLILSERLLQNRLLVLTNVAVAGSEESFSVTSDVIECFQRSAHMLEWPFCGGFSAQPRARRHSTRNHDGLTERRFSSL